eukprot:RCo050402
MTQAAGSKAQMGEVQQRILQLCQSEPEGIPLDFLRRELSTVPREIMNAAVRGLLETKRIQSHMQGETRMIKAAQLISQRLHGLGENERLLYDLLEQAGNKGATMRELGHRSHLQIPQVVKSLKFLIGRNIAKEVRNVANRMQKVYMLAELEPSVQVTGGTWYTESGEYDVEMVKVLQHQCLRRIKEMRSCSTKALVEWIATSEISTVTLYEQDVQALVNCLVYDGLVEEVEDMAALPGSRAVLYKISDINPSANPEPLTGVPCGTCPVFDHCSNSRSSAISPYTCPYLAEWMKAS